ncbi:hypothetical protein IE077_002377 [Cardiosporidium cionae]|uniref:Zinc finger CCCH-type with G patch domain-containing protein n=1 Tax=Cardiosporidium cionae TaxID=476202 RepID=A0ABQ7JFL8_9APIC|nr:hypothetical protein IE077_002377 [Cardiosporidium cionae]|eukprot:KAF8822833.1 hypothetical protein IE077_002377 [Cardiosporidium cionae]
MYSTDIPELQKQLQEVQEQLEQLNQLPASAQLDQIKEDLRNASTLLLDAILQHKKSVLLQRAENYVQKERITSNCSYHSDNTKVSQGLRAENSITSEHSAPFYTCSIHEDTKNELPSISTSKNEPTAEKFLVKHVSDSSEFILSNDNSTLSNMKNFPDKVLTGDAPLFQVHQSAETCSNLASTQNSLITEVSLNVVNIPEHEGYSNDVRMQQIKSGLSFSDTTSKCNLIPFFAADKMGLGSHSSTQEYDRAKEELFRFPVRAFNGSYSWHLGRICDARFSSNVNDNTATEEDAESSDGSIGSSDLCVANSFFKNEDYVLVIYAAPQCEKQIACRQFLLLGACDYQGRCKFHHGSWIRLEDVYPVEWDPIAFIQTDALVFAKYTDGLWYKAHVTRVTKYTETSLSNPKLQALKEGVETNVASLRVTVMYDPPYEHEHTVRGCLILPFIEELQSDSSAVEEKLSFSRECSHSGNISQSNSCNIIEETDEKVSSSNSTDTEAPSEVNAVKQAFENPDLPEEFGKWLKYSNGFGMKMLLKMGYVMGTGLGSKTRSPDLGKAIVAPIPIRIIPQGRSLDFISKKPPKRRGKRGSGRVHLAMKYGDEFVRENLQRPQQRGMFGLMNSGLMDGLGSIREKAEVAIKAGENRHRHDLSQLRRNKLSEGSLRSRLFECQEKVKQMKNALQLEEEHLNRHATKRSKERDSRLLATFASACDTKRSAISQLEAEQRILQEKIRNVIAEKKLKHF